MLKNYLTIALRNLRHYRTYTTLNVLGLTVGMAGGILIFLFISYHLSTDRHHQKFDRIFRIVVDLHLEDGSVETYPEAPLPMAKVLRDEFSQVEQATSLKTLRELTVSFPSSKNGSSQRFLEQNTGALIESEWFDVFDYQWLKGNPKTSLREPNTVVLTETWAKKYFGNEDPIGKVLDLNHLTKVKVTGVLADPPRTTNNDVQLFISMGTFSHLLPDQNLNDWWALNSTDRVYLTLKNPSSAAQVAAAFPALAQKHYGKDASVFQFHIQPLSEVHFDVKRTGGALIQRSLLWSLGWIGAFLILIACLNFINLATAQSLSRAKEIGIRKTLGSSKWQVMRQFLLETALIVTTAAIGAGLLVVLILPFVNQWLGLNLTFTLNAQATLLLTVLLVGIIGLAGGYPAFMMSGFSPWQALKGKGVLPKKGGLSLRQSMIVVQFAICQALLIGTMVVTRQMKYVEQSDLGFKKDNVLVVNLPDPSPTALTAFKNSLLQYPEIQSVSAAYRPPSASVMNGGSFKFDNRAQWEAFPIRERLGDADYLKTYGLQLVAGRNVAPSDTIREYVVNEALLKKLNIKDPNDILGHKIETYLSPVAAPVVGVVKDFHLRSLREQIEPCVISTQTARYRKVGVRVAAASPSKTLNHVRQTWQKIYPNEVFSYEYLDEQLAKFYETEQLTVRLASVFSVVAILIGCLGLYGLVLLVVARRTKEIGVRKVLGASVASIVQLLSIDFLKPILVAIVLATPAAWYLMNEWLADFAYRIEVNWLIPTLAGLLTVLIAFLTLSFRSAKAALADPVEALKTE
ncbi:putative ABC transport system permease protein [Runella defluvii]|uniref:Putative ABC transport system permease protein n=1 Tax=Runella defluvii TaxID=370973 RepID=A0A7W6ETN8_9BACT|nr:ABC transporter permease [Runella defluvii]MBB3842055.1 putative ABC transport system permease protein [Runella defluvii]